MKKHSLPPLTGTGAGHDRQTDAPHACTGHCRSRSGEDDHERTHPKQKAREFPAPPCTPAERNACRIGGIILAAGRASRMGTCKAVLPLPVQNNAAGCTILQSAAQALQGGCNGPVIVVTGFHADVVRPESARLGMATVHNPDADTGMFSSIRTGLAALLADAPPAQCSSAMPDSTAASLPDGIFVLPVDIPLVRPSTCALLAEDFSRHRAAVTYPVFAGERGHPPLLRADVARLALGHTGEGGLRRILEAAETAGLPVRDVETADAAMLTDMDTPQDYEAVLRLWAVRVTREVPSGQEIDRLLQLAQTPAHVQAHGVCVARAAVCMGRHLNERRMVLFREAAPGHRRHGTPQHDPAGLLDLDLMHAAGCLHDICKGARHHEQAGGLFLARHGFDKVGGIVAAHRDIDPAAVATITERELVMLADKFIRGTTLVPIAERFDERLREWAHDAQAVADISGRKSRALTLCSMLEEELGTDVYMLLARNGLCPAT